MVAFNSAHVNVNGRRRRGDIARDGFYCGLSDDATDRHRSFRFDLPAGSPPTDVWGDTTPPKPKSPAANDDIKTHDVLLAGNAGFVTSPIGFVEQLLAEGETEQQSRIVAQKLAACGWNPYLRSESKVVLIGTVTGAIRDATNNYRNCNIIPAVAKRNRAELLSEFRLFLSENRRARRYSRYLVVSSGARFLLEELSERYKKFSAKIGRFLEKAKDTQTFSVEIHLVTIEMTFDKEGTVNLHANIVYQPKKALGAKRWREFLEFGRKRFKTSFFHDAGRVKEPAEIIKYVCKPGEILSLTSDQTAYLADALHNKQLVRPVGGFAAWRKTLHEACHKIRYDRVARKLVRVRRFSREQEIRSVIEATNCADARTEARRQGRIRDDVKVDASEGSVAVGGDQKSEVIENQILGTTFPQARSNVLAETYVVVRNYTAKPTTKGGIRGLEAIDRRRVHYVNLLARRAVAREIVEQAGAPDSIFNTLTIIPLLAHFALPRLSEKARKQLFKRLHLPDCSPPELFRQALRSRLQTLLPTRCHQWSEDVANVVKLYDAEVARQDAFRAAQDEARNAKRVLHHDDWLDDEIPFETPKTPYVQPQRPAVPPPSPIQMPAWFPTPPIVRPPKLTTAPSVSGSPLRFRKPAFLTSRANAT